jgi:hypothetical protein
MRSFIAASLAALPWLGGCASGPPAPPGWTAALSARADALEAALAGATPSAPGELVVHLAFEAGADLDLYVTDPLEETIYFANTPARSGGTLDADRRCEGGGAAAVETVRFAPPLAGRYRVGVDFQDRCGRDANVVPWVIAVDARGERRLLRGLASWNVFASRVDEFLYSSETP